MSTDILYPLLIGAGCLALVWVVHLLTRPKPSRSDITLPASGTEQPKAANARELNRWHRDHEATVLSFLEVVDGVADQNEGIEIDAASVALDAAIDDHPAPEMRAELSALRSAGQAMDAAKARHDNDALERHLAVYQQYRHAWLDRLWQFPIDSARVATARRRNEDDLDASPPDMDASPPA